MKVFGVINSKGGVGKTTTTVNLGHALALEGKRVLLIDADMQDNIRIWLDMAQQKISLFDVLVNDRDIIQALTKVRENLFVIPSGGEDLGAIPYLLKDREGAAFKLKKELEKVEDRFDYVLIDCSPARTLMHTIVMLASDQILIPVNMEFLSSVGSVQVKKAIDDVRTGYGSEVEIGLIIPTFVDRRRSRITDDILEDLKNTYKGLVSSIPIRVNSKLSEAPSYAQTIFDMNDPRGIEDFSDLAKVVMEIE